MKRIYLLVIVSLFGINVISFAQNVCSEDIFKQNLLNECAGVTPTNDADYSLFLKAMQTDSVFEKLKLLTKFFNDNTKSGLADVYTYRGLTFSNLKLYDSALNYFTQAINLNQKDPNLFYFRGDTYSHLHNYVMAIDDFSQAIELDKTMYMAFYFRGICYYVLGDVNKALDDISKTFQLVKASNKTV